jgi:hypothetical protein
MTSGPKHTLLEASGPGLASSPEPASESTIVVPPHAAATATRLAIDRRSIGLSIARRAFAARHVASG